MPRPLIIAHRALTPNTGENAISSLPALEAAGADLVELDIRLSLDRHPFVTHDAFLSRTTQARGWVRMWPSSMLRRVVLRRGEPEERLPLLREMLGVMPSGLQPALHLKDRGALNQVLRIISRHGDPARTWLWLGHPQDITHARHRLPDLRCTLLRPKGWSPQHRDAYIRDAQACGAHAASLPWGVLTAELIDLFHEHDLLVFSRLHTGFPIVEPLRLGIDGIITDDPAGIRAHI